MTESTDHQTCIPTTTYIGRFAPSPTGPLHAGSLIAALASFLDARANGGRWLVRMEDLDPPRESPEAAEQIIHALIVLGLEWDGELQYQSNRLEAYRNTLHQLHQHGLAFACDCSRQDILDAGGSYPGTCRERGLKDRDGHAIRCRVDDDPVTFDDRLQGPQSQILTQSPGDFVIRRKDGLFAYQLAVVVDDGWQGITHVVRGIDLMESTCRQIYLQRLLDLPTPAYCHIPVIVNAQGQKLSKQHMADAIALDDPASTLVTGLDYLNQSPDPALAGCSPHEVLDWAVDHWQPQKLAGTRQLAEFERPV